MFQWMLKLLCTWNPLCPKDYVELTSEKKKAKPEEYKRKNDRKGHRVRYKCLDFWFLSQGCTVRRLNRDFNKV